MNVVLWFPRTFLTLVLWQSLFAYCCDEESAESPYVVDQEWKQLLDVDPPIDDELRGAKLLKLLEHQLGAKAPAWWQPLVKSVGTGHRSAHMIENDNAVESLSKRWNTEGNAPFTGFTAVMGSVTHLQFGRSSLPRRTFAFAQRRTQPWVERTFAQRRRVVRQSAVVWSLVATSCEVLSGRKDLQNTVLSGRNR
jgi:hypothetical protein